MANYYVKKLRVYLTRDQELQFMKYLDDTTFFFNTCLDARNEFLEKYKEYIRENNIIKEKYPFWKFCDEFNLNGYTDLKIINRDPNFFDRPKKDRLPRDVRDKIKLHLEFMYKMYFKGLYPTKPRHKMIKKGNTITKIYLPNGHKNIKFKEDDRKRIKIPYLGFIKITNSEYILDDEINNIAAGHLQKEMDGTYSLLLTFKIDEDNDLYHKYIDDLSDGIGIDLGIRKYAIIAGKEDRVYLDPYKSNAKLQHQYMRAKKFQSIAQRKVQWHVRQHPEMSRDEVMDKYIYPSKKLQRTYEKHRKALQKVDNIMKAYIQNIINDIVKNIKPQFITIECIDTHAMRKHASHILMEQVYMRKFSLFRRMLTNACHKYGIELRVADPCYPSSKICSSCDHVYESLSNQKVFICPNCGLRIDRDKNAALNLYHLDSFNYNLF